MACGYASKAAQHSRNYHKEALRTVYRRRLEHLGLKLQQLDLEPSGQHAETGPWEAGASENLLTSQLPGSTLLPSDLRQAAKADLLSNEISSLHEERQDLRRQVEAADRIGSQEAGEAVSDLEGARSRFLEAQLRRDRLRRLVRGLEGGQEPLQPVSLQEREREMEQQVAALRSDTNSLGERQQDFLHELQNCRRLAAQRTAELRHAEELGSEALARRAALQLELKLLQEKIFAVETERQELWQKQRHLGEQFERAWQAAMAEAQRRLGQLRADAEREAGDATGLGQAADDAEAKIAMAMVELRRQQDLIEAATQRGPASKQVEVGTSMGLELRDGYKNAWRDFAPHLLRESLRAELAELRLLEASTKGVESRTEGLQDSLAAALSTLEELKQELERGRLAKAEAQKTWAKAQRAECEERSRALQRQVRVLESWNVSTRGRLQRLRQCSKPKASRRSTELWAELEGHLGQLRISFGSLPISAGSLSPGFWRSTERANFDLRCWQQALRGLRQALQQAQQAISGNEEQVLHASLLEADDALQTVLSLFQLGVSLPPGTMESWHAADVADVAQCLRDQVELESRRAARAIHPPEHSEDWRDREPAGNHSSTELLEKELRLEEAQEEEEEEELRHRELELALLAARREDVEAEARAAGRAAEAARAAEATCALRSPNLQKLCCQICKEMIRSLHLQFQELCDSAAHNPQVFKRQTEEIHELKQTRSAISATQAQALASADLLEAELQAAWVATLSAIEEVKGSTKELAMERDRCRLALDATRARADAVEEEAASLQAMRGEATSLSIQGGGWHDRLRSLSEWYSVTSDALHSCML